MNHKTPISQIELENNNLQAWTLEEGILTATLKIPSFTQGAELLLEIARHADEVNHHPQLILDYGTLEVRTSSHDAGGKATQRDVQMALFIHELTMNKDLSYATSSS